MKTQKAFWIASGAVVLLEVAVWVLALPDIDMIGSAKAAQDSKRALDDEYRHLQELDRRSQHGNPTGVIFDPEKADDIAKLTGDYLITTPWKEALAPHVAGYDRQLASIKTFLTQRSQSLHKPVADSGDKLGWYTAYQAATEAQLKRLVAANAIRLPASKDQTPVDLGIDRDARAVGGFFTKGSEFPEEAEHPRLTLQLRIMERIIDALLDGRAVNSVNPIAGGAPATPSVAILTSVRWGGGEGGEPGKDSQVPLDELTKTQAQAHRVTVQLAGPLSALLAAQAALERSAELDRPVVIVTGSEVGRSDTFAPGERKDVAFESASVRLRLVVLDFAPPEAPAAPAVEAPAAPPAAPAAPTRRHAAKARPAGESE